MTKFRGWLNLELCKLLDHKWQVIAESDTIWGSSTVYQCKRCTACKTEGPPPPQHVNCRCVIQPME